MRFMHHHLLILRKKASKISGTMANIWLAPLCVQLNGALLTDEEMEKYVARWSAVPDPHHPSATQKA
jgi:hypothetical protein